MEVGYEERGLDVDIHMRMGLGGSGYTNARFSFRPDMVVCTFKKRDDKLRFSDRKWEKFEDSNWIVFEAETNPRNIFNNLLKMTAYETIRAKPQLGRVAYAFVLLTFTKYEKFLAKRSIDPFDEAWLFNEENMQSEPKIIRDDTI
ncbi:MAG: hypothetical protein ACTSPB_01235 [Candidatus Thorarchaeota archaeon]